MNDHSTDDVIVMGDNARARLRKAVQDFESIQADIDASKEDQKEVLALAKADGLDVKTIRKAIRERRLTAEKRDRDRALLDLYLSVL